MKKKILSFLTASVLVLSLPGTCLADFFALPGDFLYALNSQNDVMDVTSDGAIGVVLTDRLISFDPVSGQIFDSQPVGFGPAGVRIANTPDGPRVVVLTTEGGPNTITIYDLDSSGSLSQRATSRLTNSNVDFRSNLILGSGNAGYLLVNVSGQNYALVSFSLDDGTILGSLPVRSPLPSLGMSEVGDGRTLVYVSGISSDSTVVAIDASDPAQMRELGSAQLVRTQQFSGSTYVDFAFSSDGSCLFVANSFFEFAVFDMSTMQRISTIDSTSYFSRVKLSEQDSGRLLALVGFDPVSFTSSLLLVNASDPSDLNVLNQVDVSNDFPGYFTFAKSGDRILAATDTRLKALDVPTLATVWEQPNPNSQEGRAHQVLTFGDPETVLGSWGTTHSTLGSFPVFAAAELISR